MACWGLRVQCPSSAFRDKDNERMRHLGRILWAFLAILLLQGSILASAHNCFPSPEPPACFEKPLCQRCQAPCYSEQLPQWPWAESPKASLVDDHPQVLPGRWRGGGRSWLPATFSPWDWLLEISPQVPREPPVSSS